MIEYKNLNRNLILKA